jgi:hypothetical protein
MQTMQNPCHEDTKQVVASTELPQFLGFDAGKVENWALWSGIFEFQTRGRTFADDDA